MLVKHSFRINKISFETMQKPSLSCARHIHILQHLLIGMMPGYMMSFMYEKHVSSLEKLGEFLKSLQLCCSQNFKTFHFEKFSLNLIKIK